MGALPWAALLIASPIALVSGRWYVGASQSERSTSCTYVGRNGTCFADLSPVAQLALEPQDRSPQQLASVKRVSSGNYVLATWDEDAGRVWVYGPRGGRPQLVHLLEDMQASHAGLLNTDPQGRLWFRIRNTDTLVAIDGVPGVPSYRVVPGVRMAPAFLPLDSGRIAYNAALHLSGHSGQPLHLQAGDDLPLRSFGVERPSFRADSAKRLLRAIARCPGQPGFWSATRYEAELTKWTSDGRLSRRLLMEDRMALGSTPGQAIGAAQQLHPRIQLLSCSRAGRLFVVSLIPEPRFAKDASTAARLRPSDFDEPSRLFDSLVELRDADTGVLLAQAVFDRALTLVLDEDVFATIGRTEGGRGAVNIVRVKFHCESPRLFQRLCYLSAGAARSALGRA